MAGRKSSASHIKMPSVDVLFGLETESGNPAEKVEEVAIEKLYPFKDHPFRVPDDEKMQETVESIREHGVICPMIVRPGKEAGYEIIAGYRRKRACELLGLETVPCFIRDLTDEESTIAMIDSNIQREELLYSEKAYAYKMKLDALNRQGRRLCVFPNLVQARKLKELSRDGKLDGNGMEIILSSEKKAAPTVKLQRKKLDAYFPPYYTVEQMVAIIYELLEKWSFEQGNRKGE